MDTWTFFTDTKNCLGPGLIITDIIGYLPMPPVIEKWIYYDKAQFSILIKLG